MKTQISFCSVLEKVDDALSKDNFQEAERILNYWVGQAVSDGDKSTELSLLNELIGLYRKQNEKGKGLAVVSRALVLLDELKLTDLTYGTVMVNAATAYKVFGLTDKALELYNLAEVNYRQNVSENDKKFAALYNNEGSLFASIGNAEKATACYEKAIAILDKSEGNELEKAISLLNIADVTPNDVENESKIDNLVDSAYELFNAKGLKRDSYYSFVCKKCASAFGYYGYFLYEQDLLDRAKKIDERN